MWPNTTDNSKYHCIENVTARDSPRNSDISHPDAPDDTLFSDDESTGTVVYDGDGRNNGSDHDEKPATWRSLPKKSQLASLSFARRLEPLSQTSLLAYMFYQLASRPHESAENSRLTARNCSAKLQPRKFFIASILI